MKLAELRDIIKSCFSDVTFVYNNKPSGVVSEVNDSVPVFHAWHGDDTRDYTSLDELFIDKFFSGKSLIQLANKVNITVC